MNYFRPYALSSDQTIIAAWDSQIAQSSDMPWLAETLAARSGELFPRFAECYAQLRALPRNARRGLQRQLARSSELADILPDWLTQQGGAGLQRKLASSLAGAALLLALGQGLAQAGSMTVNTTKPAINVTDGKCSIIEAIRNANAGFSYFTDCYGAGYGANTIHLPKGTITLTYAYPNYYFSPTGLPVITSSITITGNKTKIMRKPSASAFRLMAVTNSGSLTLNNLTLNKGNSTYGGGAVLNTGYLTINNSTITGNTASGGGGVSNYKGYLTVNNSTISKNVASKTGGGIYNSAYLPGNEGTLQINDSTITGNKAANYGGGIFSYGTYADVYIKGSTISKNSAHLGGGIFNVYGAVNITPDTVGNPSKVTGNTARYVGGGVGNYKGQIYMDRVTLSKNTATKYVGGGVNNARGYLTIQNSTITGNKTKYLGGGIYNFYPTGFVHFGNTYSKNKAKYFPDVYTKP